MLNFKLNTATKNKIIAIIVYLLAIILLVAFHFNYGICKSVAKCGLPDDLQGKNLQIENSPITNSSTNLKIGNMQKQNVPDNLNLKKNEIFPTHSKLLYPSILLVILAFIAMLGNTIWDVCKSCLEKLHFRVRRDHELTKQGLLKPLHWNTKKAFIREKQEQKTSSEDKLRLNPSHILFLKGETGSGKHFEILRRCREHSVVWYITSYSAVFSTFIIYGYLYLFKDKLRYGWQKKEYRSIYSYEQYWRRTC